MRQIEQMRTLPPSLDFDEPPTEEELEAALSKMKRRKGGGKSGIPPALVLFGVVQFCGTGCWSRCRPCGLMERRASSGGLKNAEVVPIPKNGEERKETRSVVITGMVSVSWMWWESFLLGLSCRPLQSM